MMFARLGGLRLDPDRPAAFGGWAFRGPLAMHVCWDHDRAEDTAGRAADRKEAAR